jgi:hypothetical protein
LSAGAQENLAEGAENEPAEDSQTDNEGRDGGQSAQSNSDEAGEWKPPEGFDMIPTASGIPYGLQMMENYGCSNILWKCGKFKIVSSQDCEDLTISYKVFDSEHHHISTENYTVKSVSADDVVLMNFPLYEALSHSFEILAIACDGT